MVLKESRHGKFYSCSKWPDCDVTVGAHRSGAPLGKPGNKATREKRIEAHEAFDKLWKGKHKQLNRGEAYAWLAKSMRMNRQYCHIAHMNVQQCNQVIKLCRGRR